MKFSGLFLEEEINKRDERIAELQEALRIGQESLVRALDRIQELEKKLQGQEEWMERVSLGSIESAMAADKAEARIQELEAQVTRWEQEHVSIAESHPRLDGEGT